MFARGETDKRVDIAMGVNIRIPESDQEDLEVDKWWNSGNLLSTSIVAPKAGRQIYPWETVILAEVGVTVAEGGVTVAEGFLIVAEEVLILVDGVPVAEGPGQEEPEEGAMNAG
ncbi:hypothetical protein Bbelb_130070 [Branchiostoma belcheri]|nr:hypothetical protein Bbelb_130070 [Branchiostoma belcheri]